MRKKPDKRIVGVAYEPIDERWSRRTITLECGHTRESVVLGARRRKVTGLRHCYECDSEDDGDGGTWDNTTWAGGL